MGKLYDSYLSWAKFHMADFLSDSTDYSESSLHDAVNDAMDDFWSQFAGAGAYTESLNFLKNEPELFDKVPPYQSQENGAYGMLGVNIESKLAEDLYLWGNNALKAGNFGDVLDQAILDFTG